jgi:hypothetical protein
MESYLAQLVLAARSDDVEKWSNILLVVVLAVFWAVAGLIKAKKTQQQGEEEQLGRTPGHKLAPALGDLRKKLLQQSARPRLAGPVPGARHRPQARQRLLTAVGTQPAAGSGLGAEPQAPPEPVNKPIEKLHDYRPSAAEKPPGPEFSPAFLPAYDDPEQLRRAILHYEILGKPLALRDPGGQIIGP